MKKNVKIIIKFMAISLAFLSIISCKDNLKAETKSKSPAATATANTKVTQEKTEPKVSALDVITFNKDKAVADKGSKKMRDITAFQAISEMKTGWNLGNTFDATGSKDLSSEWSWGQPKTTKAMIDGLVKSGIKTIRIPVSWSNHLIAAERQYTINPAWMSRVKEVVDWAIEDGMYVILNTHHDNFDKNAKMYYGSGYYPSEENYDESIKFLANTWAQISLAFNNGYDEHLIFETLNEPRLRGTTEEWYYNSSSIKGRKSALIVNQFNQEILNVIRASGGNNEKRFVACPGLQASPDSALAYEFKMPVDINGTTEKLMVSVHMYSPYNFAMESPGLKTYTDAIGKEVDNMFVRLENNFIKKGYAVYIGEYGATNKDNLDDRVKWFHSFVGNARKRNMVCCLWDNAVWKITDDKYDEHYGYYNRQEQTWYFPEILKAIQEETK